MQEDFPQLMPDYTTSKDIILPYARLSLCPNHDERPDNCEIELLIIHNISLPPGEYGGHWIDDLFNNRLDPLAHPYFEHIYSLKVSSHLLIRRNGEIVQYVPMNRRAWHAGKSTFQGKNQCNDFSIGIELEGTDTQAYTILQYTKLIQATLDIIKLYPNITVDRIVGHADVAPERKTDPGPSFDWVYYRSMLQQAS